MIKVYYYASVREKTGTNETRVDGFSSGDHTGTIVDLVKHLEEHYGISLTNSDSPLTERANYADIISALIVMVNGRHIAHVGGLDALVADGDVVSIFPLIGGG